MASAHGIVELDNSGEEDNDNNVTETEVIDIDEDSEDDDDLSSCKSSSEDELKILSDNETSDDEIAIVEGDNSLSNNNLKSDEPVIVLHPVGETSNHASTSKGSKLAQDDLNLDDYENFVDPDLDSSQTSQINETEDNVPDFEIETFKDKEHFQTKCISNLPASELPTSPPPNDYQDLSANNGGDQVEFSKNLHSTSNICDTSYLGKE